ncbi:MAG: YtxH domain-containing protein [Cyanobacteria bacterium SZAS LIN-3]|nr:YtxH domain-containing protein [Cyanobacteria bacterium SZAS LIN-3]
MIDTLIKSNLPLLKTVFIAGAVAGMAVGGTVGAGVGYVMGNLCAPKSGKDLRDDIANQVSDVFSFFTGSPTSAETRAAKNAEAVDI